MTRLGLLLTALCCLCSAYAQDKGADPLRAKADALFTAENFNEAMPLYAQLVSLHPGDHDLNYRLGTCVVYSGRDKETAIGFLKFAVQNASTPPLAWYELGRAYHLTYRFKEALDAYRHFRGMEDRKALATHPVDALEKQCQNGLQLLSNLKEVGVQSKVEVDDNDFFHYYDLTGIGGRIIVTPDELMSSLDKKSKERSLIYLPEKGGRIYFSSYGKDGRTGRDIYSTAVLPGGGYEEPRKLAGYVNTDQDESFAAMAPDGKTLYFASKGHNSMGGYDVFKCPYDQGLDVYGAPVNMDFAVNTPSDDILYMVDGEGMLACFASARDSEQGKIHVYRVNTSQQPIIISVLKGTFASAIDPQDRDAHITVEDAVTHEQVADVKSDINGEYVLSLPRNGRFKFSVHAGTSGKTHVGMVEVPKSEGPRAYRQELTLVNDGGEKLVIKNYFDDPLPDDLIALALDEIKRRAKLEVNNLQPPVEAPVAEAPISDVITAAGFTGDVTKESAQRLATEDVNEQRAKSEILQGMSGSAYSTTLEALGAAEAAMQEARDLVAQASATQDPVQANDLMTKAAEARQRSRLAALQARAAYRAGQDLALEQDRTEQAANTAAALNDRIATALKSGNDQAAVDALKELKARVDEKNRPDAGIGPDEQARRNAVAKEKEAAIALQQANAKRDEEDQLIDQLGRLKRQRDEAKGGKKQDLEKQVTEYEGYRAALHDEVEQAFNKARSLENETAIARAQTSLTRHLATNGTTNATELDPQQLASLEEKLAVTDRTIAALPIDERYDAQTATVTPLAQRTDFDWDLADAKAGTDDHATTAVVVRDAAGGAERADARQTNTIGTEVNGQLADGGAVPQIAISNDAPGVEQRMADGNGGQDTRPDFAAQGDVNATQVSPDAADNGERTATNGQQTDRSATGDANTASTATLQPGGSQPQGTATMATDPDGSINTADLPLTPEPGTTTGDTKPDADREAALAQEQGFLKENELAETRQLRSVARTRPMRDSLDARIATLEMEVAANRLAVTEAMSAAANDVSTTASETDRPAADATDGSSAANAIDFNTSTPEATIISAVFASYAGGRERIDAMANATERPASSNALERMLLDSLAAQTQAQLARLEAHPDEASVILPRVDRLRTIKDAHQQLADAAALAAGDPLAEDQRLVSAQGSIPIPDQPTAEEVSQRYVAVEDDPEYIYESKLDTRANANLEAVAEHERDVVAMIELEDRIDSLEEVLSNMAFGKEYDKLRDKTDRLIDDRMILRTEVGQRSAFITREEWKAGMDSLKQVRVEVMKMGLAPSEPLMVLARQMEDDAQQRFNEAAQWRRKADRTEDIVLRDSLLRQAFATELDALNSLDHAITVNNYVISDHFDRGDHPSYTMLEAELFGVPLAQVEEGMADDGTLEHDAAIADGAVSVVPAGSQEADTGVSADRSPGDRAATDQPIAGSGIQTPGSANTSGDPAAAQQQGNNAGQTSSAQPGVGTQGNSAQAVDAASAARARQLYQASLESQSVSIGSIPVDDQPQDMVMALRQAQAGSAELEQRSLVLGDRASALRDSATTAKKRDRVELEAEARRVQFEADSLHLASLAMADSARMFEERARAAAEAQRLKQDLGRFYYLSGEEQAMVLNVEDYGRYFMARSKAMEELELAAQAAQEAKANRDLSAHVLKEAQAIMAPADGSAPAADAQERAALLNARAVSLTARADSLDRAGARFNAAADMNERQAAVFLEKLDPVLSSRIMALEQGARRTEPFLAEAHSLAGEGIWDFEGMEKEIARTDGSRAVAADATIGGVNTAPISTASNGANTAGVRPANGSHAANGGDATAPDGANATNTNASASAPNATDPAAIPRPALPAAMGYLPPAVLAADIFELRDENENSPTAISIDAPKPSGIVYSVQVGAFRHPIPADLFDDMVPVMGESAGNGLTRYTAGLFVEYASANHAKELVRARGYRDAFVVAYKDGKRVTLAEARGGSDRPPVADNAGRTVTISAPSQVPAAPAITPTPADTGLLAKYPADAQAILEKFTPAAEATTYYNDPRAAPARQVETVKGLFFTVQVGVYSKPVPLDKLFNITPLNSERTETAKIRYTTGVYLDMEKARVRKDQAVGLGVADAFITAYLNGRRIPMTEARALLARHGSAILADPSIETK